MIPKTIHYCWFGGNSFPPKIKKCIKSWRKYCPDYQIVEWNDTNVDIDHMPPYVQQAYKAKKWAYVSDYVRLWVIYNNGGIYLDTDVELIKSLSPLLSHKAFFGFESNDYKTVATGLGFGAEKGVGLLKELMETYQDLSFPTDKNVKPTPNTWINWPVFEKHGVVRNDTMQEICDGIAIYPGEYFDPMHGYFDGEICVTEKTFSIHHYTMTWLDNRENIVRQNKRLRRRTRRARVLKRIFGEKLYGAIRRIVKEGK